VPAFRLPLCFLVVLIPSFTLRDAGLSAWQGTQIIDRTRDQRYCAAMKANENASQAGKKAIQAFNLKAQESKHLSFFVVRSSATQRSSGSGLSRAPPRPCERLGNQWCPNSLVKAIRVCVRSLANSLVVQDPDHFFRRTD
jgi:hypothetical protein